MQRGDYVKRKVVRYSKSDPPYEYGRLRLLEGHDQRGPIWLVYWWEPGTWSLRRSHEFDLTPASEQEYFKHCLRYGND